MLSAEKENRAVDAKWKSRGTRRQPASRSGNASPGFFIKPAWKAALNIQASFEEGSGR
jgi:hypothetical protein